MDNQNLTASVILHATEKRQLIKNEIYYHHLFYVAKEIDDSFRDFTCFFGDNSITVPYFEDVSTSITRLINNRELLQSPANPGFNYKITYKGSEYITNNPQIPLSARVLIGGFSQDQINNFGRIFVARDRFPNGKIEEIVHLSKEEIEQAIAMVEKLKV